MKKDVLVNQSRTTNGIGSFFSAIISKIVSSSLFGMFSSFGSSEAVKNSVLLSKADAIIKSSGKKITEFKYKVARKFADSKPACSVEKFGAGLMKLPLRSYGLGFFVFGVCALASSYFKSVSGGQTDYASFITGIFCITAALMMFTSQKPLGKHIKESMIMSALLTKILFLRLPDVSVSRKQDGKSKPVFFIGLFFGLLTFISSPKSIIISILYIILAAVALMSPEACISAALLGLPFIGENYFCVFIFIAFASYILKYIKGKRVAARGIDGLFPIVIGLIGIIRCAVCPDGSEISLIVAAALPILYITVRNMFCLGNLDLSLGDVLGYSYFFICFARIVYCAASAFGAEIPAFFKSIGSEAYTTEFSALCIGFSLYGICRSDCFSRRLLFILFAGFSSAFMLYSGETVLFAAAVTGIIVFLAASRQKSAVFAAPFILFIPFLYFIFRNLSAVNTVFALFSADGGAEVRLCLNDFLFVYGIGGAILTAVYILLRLSSATHRIAYGYSEKRTLYAAVYSFTAALAVAVIFGKGIITPQTLYLTVTVFALSAASGENAKYSSDYGLYSID